MYEVDDFNKIFTRKKFNSGVISHLMQFISIYRKLLFTSCRKQSGFTLIEILVVFSVIAILAGVGIASFVSYSRFQEVNQAANSIKLLVNEAKFNSLSVVKTLSDQQGQSITCGVQSLVGYRVDIIQPRTLNLIQVCDLNSTTVKSIELPQTISFSTGTSCLSIQFSSLSANALGVPCEIQITGFSESKTISIDRVGNVAIN